MFKSKYIKYKNKYLALKNTKQFQKGGFTCNQKIGYKNILGTCWMVAIQMIFTFGSISGHNLEENIREMTIGDMIERAKNVPNVEKILPDVLDPTLYVNLEKILNSFIKRYRSKLELPDMNKTVKPLSLIDGENKERCELVIAENFKYLFASYIGRAIGSDIESKFGGYIEAQYLFSNLLSIFLLGRKTSFINYYPNHPNPKKNISNIKYINNENYGILIHIEGHVCCFFTCRGVEKYYNDNDMETYHCQWKELLKKTTKYMCLYVQKRGCILLLSNEEYIHRHDISTLQKVTCLSVLSTNEDTNSFDNDIENYIHGHYDNLLKPETDLQILKLIDNIDKYFETSDQYFETRDKYLQYYKICADQGHDYSQYALGGMYLEQGNIEESINYHKMAADQYYMYSQHALGMIYENEKNKCFNLETAIDYYKLAAIQGFMISQHALGMIYENKKNKCFNLDTAFYYYVLAADQGYKESKLRLIEIQNRKSKLILKKYKIENRK